MGELFAPLENKFWGGASKFSEHDQGNTIFMKKYLVHKNHN